MWNNILALLAWMGLYEPSLRVFNNASPALRQPLNGSYILDLTSEFLEKLLVNYATKDRRQLSYLALEQSHFYKQGFSELGTLMQSIDPIMLNPQERKTLFINLYNLLTIQSIVSMDTLPQSTISVPNFWRRYGYKVGAYTLHLDDIEHGILRGNRPHPTTGDTMFKDRDDPRLALALPPDNRIHAALNCGAKSCPPLQTYYVDTLDEQLDNAMQTFTNSSVTILPDNSLVINSIFQWFRIDFGSNEASVLTWLAKEVTDPAISKALIEASEGKRRFNYNYNWDLNAVSGANGGKVKVDVYFSSLCSDTMRFFTNQLYPTWTELKDIIDLNLIPYGKARATPKGTGDYTFECQHGPNECHGNKIMACVQSSLPIGQQVDMIHCMMSKSYPPFAGTECSRELGIEWEPIRSCSQGSHGSKLLYNNGVQTSKIKPSLYFVPTVTIDGHYTPSQLRTSLQSLKNQICQFYKGPSIQNCN